MCESEYKIPSKMSWQNKKIIAKTISLAKNRQQQFHQCSFDSFNPFWPSLLDELVHLLWHWLFKKGYVSTLIKFVFYFQSLSFPAYTSINNYRIQIPGYCLSIWTVSRPVKWMCCKMCLFCSMLSEIVLNSLSDSLKLLKWSIPIVLFENSNHQLLWI